MRLLVSLFNDEKDRLSAARVFFAVWTGIVMWAAWHKPADAFWPLAASVMIGLLSWAAGPRIAQYLAPQAGASARATADSIKAKIQARRKPEDGYEETP